MNIKIRTFTTACIALLMIGGLHAKAQANFVLGFDMDPSTSEQETELTVAPGVEFEIDVLFSTTGTNDLPSAFGLDVMYDPTFLTVLEASFTDDSGRTTGLGQQTISLFDPANPSAGGFGIRIDTVGPFDADSGFQPLSASTFSLGRLKLVGMNNSGQDTAVPLLEFTNFTGLLATGSVDDSSVGVSTLVVTAIPEPASAWVCIMLGSVGIASRRRRGL